MVETIWWRKSQRKSYFKKEHKEKNKKTFFKQQKDKRRTVEERKCADNERLRNEHSTLIATRLFDLIFIFF